MDLCDLWDLCEIKRIIKLSFHDCHLKESLIRENLCDPGAFLKVDGGRWMVDGGWWMGAVLLHK